jgi:phosphoglycolate phosphatase-like HAD superfamily hydrolase
VPLRKPRADDRITSVDRHSPGLLRDVPLHSRPPRGREGVQLPPREEILGLEYWTRIRDERLMVGGIEVASCLVQVVSKYMAVARVLYPGVVEAIGALRESGTGLALVSSWCGSRETEALLSRCGVAEAFDVIRTQDDLPLSQRGMGELAMKVQLSERALGMPRYDENARLVVVGRPPT